MYMSRMLGQCCHGCSRCTSRGTFPWNGAFVMSCHAFSRLRCDVRRKTEKASGQEAARLQWSRHISPACAHSPTCTCLRVFLFTCANDRAITTTRTAFSMAAAGSAISSDSWLGSHSTGPPQTAAGDVRRSLRSEWTSTHTVWHPPPPYSHLVHSHGADTAVAAPSPSPSQTPSVSGGMLWLSSLLPPVTTCSLSHPTSALSGRERHLGPPMRVMRQQRRRAEWTWFWQHATYCGQIHVCSPTVAPSSIVLLGTRAVFRLAFDCSACSHQRAQPAQPAVRTPHLYPASPLALACSHLLA